MQDKESGMTMKAARIFEYGKPEVLQYDDYTQPNVGDFDVKVKVHATAVSGWDLKFRQGLLAKLAARLPGRKGLPMPQQLGRECAGEVVSVGDSVSSLAVGDRVLGLVHPENPLCINTIRGRGNLSTGIDYPGHAAFGGYAQFASRHESHWMKIPGNSSYDKVAAGAWSYPTSHRVISTRLRVSVGDVVLVTGTAGGMGSATVQWAKLAGARVIGCTRDDKKTEMLQEMGVDLVVNTHRLEEAREQVMAFTNGHGVEHSVDFTDNPGLIQLCLDSARLGGTFCPGAGSNPKDPVPLTSFNFTRLELTVVGVRGSKIDDQRIYLEQLALGNIDPIIHSVLPLSDVVTAHEILEKGEGVVGKIVLHPWG
jgi:NADPH:quinone reductase-like Zn-dependent oxidoreductase